MTASTASLEVTAISATRDPRTADPNPPGVAGGNAGGAYGSLIAEQLAEERAVKTSLEQRGVAVVSTSGVLVGLVFAFTSLLSGDRTLDLPWVARAFLGRALATFVTAAAFGLLCALPRPHLEVGTQALRDLIEDDVVWDADAETGARRAALARFATIERLRAHNEHKGELLKAALWVEVGVVGLLAVALVTALIAGRS
jgi:hypothetical protein